MRNDLETSAGVGIERAKGEKFVVGLLIIEANFGIYPQVRLLKIESIQPDIIISTKTVSIANSVSPLETRIPEPLTNAAYFGAKRQGSMPPPKANATHGWYFPFPDIILCCYSDKEDNLMVRKRRRSKRGQRH